MPWNSRLKTFDLKTNAFGDEVSHSVIHIPSSMFASEAGKPELDNSVQRERGATR